jgi:recombination protein RecT
MSNPTGTALANVRQEQRSLVESIKHPQMQAQIKASLPPSVDLDRFTAVTIAAVNHNPDLLKADRQSFYNSVIKAAQDGLLPDGNDAVLNIYNTNIAPKGQAAKWVQKVQYQRMVGGIMKLFEKAGIDAFADSVYEHDEFDVWTDENGQHCTHRPTKLGKPKGERIGAYAIARRPGGRSMVIQVMDMEALGRARAASKSPDKGPWATWPERMEQKSALHRLKKRVATIDDDAAKHLNTMDDEFEDDEPTPAEQPKQSVPTGNEKRPHSLQSVVDQDVPPVEGDAPTDAPPADQGDPGPREGDII